MKLIDKEKIVVEIERIKKEECPTDTYEGRCKLFWFEQFLSFLDTIEVKEVNLENEITQFLDTYFPNAKLGHKLSLRRTAKHFFELGMQQSKNDNNNEEKK